jgi:hypothetical protein
VLAAFAAEGVIVVSGVVGVQRTETRRRLPDGFDK